MVVLGICHTQGSYDSLPIDLLATLPPFSELGELVVELDAAGRLNFSVIYREPIGSYFFKRFLRLDGSMMRAVFLSEVDLYRELGLPSRRNRVAALIYMQYLDEGQKAATDQSPDQINLHIGHTNLIGFSGPLVKAIAARIHKDDIPVTLFDELAASITSDLRFDVFPRFRSSIEFENYIRAKHLERTPVTIDDFTMLGVLGKGSFGTVKACRRNSTRCMLAAKCFSKRMVRAQGSISSIMSERNILAAVQSRFVTCLKYAIQDQDNLMLIMDLMSGGDLYSLLLVDGRFPPDQARFYAVEILLGLQHLHKMDIVYRDLKLNNILLDEFGHCKLSDLGMAIRTRDPIEGYHGTPGHAAPEIVLNLPYDYRCDFFSYGVVIYMMLAGLGPFAAFGDDSDQRAVYSLLEFDSDSFTEVSRSLLLGLLQKNPNHRLGSNGIHEIKEHPFFEDVDWNLSELGLLAAPFIPTATKSYRKNRCNFNWRHLSQSRKDTGEFNDFDLTSNSAVQTEIVDCLDRYEEYSQQENTSNKADSKCVYMCCEY